MRGKGQRREDRNRHDPELGWKVYGSDGEKVGLVTSFDEHTLVVRKPSLLGDKEFHLLRHTASSPSGDSRSGGAGDSVDWPGSSVG